jgi:hypothetical protein
MEAAGYRVAQQYGPAIYYACQDTPAKRKYIRQRWIAADERVSHPLHQ